MILRRLGNKQKIAQKIITYFPDHDCYIEPFFGAGGMFFNKPQSKYSIINDIDNDVYNLFQQVMFNKDALYEFIDCVPYHKAAWDWLKNMQPENDLQKAIKFVILSNYGYMGKPETLKYEMRNSKKELLKNTEKTFDFLCRQNGHTVQFNNADFRKFFKDISLDKNDINKAFIYNDPPYIGTDNNYSDSFKESDSIDLFDCLEAFGCRFAMSEFNNDFIMDQAKKRKLNIITIGERQNMKNRRIEILITNYNKQLKLF